MSHPDALAIPLSTEDQTLLRRFEAGEAAFALPEHALLSLRGADVIPYLHTKLTADTKGWPESGGGYGIATNINGQLVLDAHFRAHGDAFLALVEPGQLASGIEHLDRFVIMEDVVLSDVTSEYAVFLLHGNQEGVSEQGFRALSLFGAEVLATVIRWDSAMVSWVLVPTPSRAAFVAGLDRAEIALGGTRHWQAWTLRQGIALGSVDLIVDKTIPLESGSWHGVSLNKGCYLGQEVIERLFSRGRANKRLMRLRVEGREPLDEATLECGGKEAGWITRWTHPAEGDGLLAHGYVKRKYLGETETLSVAGRAVHVLDYVGGETPGPP